MPLAGLLAYLVVGAPSPLPPQQAARPLRDSHVVEGYRTMRDRSIARHGQTVAVKARTPVKLIGALSSAFGSLPFSGSS